MAYGLAIGALSGAAGAAAMAAASKVEQLATGRRARRDVGQQPTGTALLIDVSHKALYSFVTGALADALVAPSAGSSERRHGFGRRAKGFA